MAREPSNPPADAGEGFLARWSRRKRDDQEAKRDDVSAPPAEPSPSEASAPRAEGAGPPAGPPAPVVSGDAADVVRPTLPPIESLGAESDYAAFLRPGVAPDLQRAALRRMWASVPGIAPVEIAEAHMGDFNAVPTFPEGLKDTLFDAVKGLVDRVASAAENTPPPSTDDKAAAASSPGTDGDADAVAERVDVAQGDGGGAPRNDLKDPT